MSKPRTGMTPLELAIVVLLLGLALIAGVGGFGTVARVLMGAGAAV